MLDSITDNLRIVRRASCVVRRAWVPLLVVRRALPFSRRGCALHALLNLHKTGFSGPERISSWSCVVPWAMTCNRASRVS